jgi:hypothetical protein
LPTLLRCLLNLNEWDSHTKVTKIAPVSIAMSVRLFNSRTVEWIHMKCYIVEMY